MKIAPIDLVIVDLYPFEATVASGAKPTASSKNRHGLAHPAARRNYNDVVIVASSVSSACSGHPRRTGAETTAAPDLCPQGICSIISDDSTIHRFPGNLEPGKVGSARSYRRSNHFATARSSPGSPPGTAGCSSTSFTARKSYNNLPTSMPHVAHGRITEPPFAVLKPTTRVASRQTIVGAWKDALAGGPYRHSEVYMIANGKVSRPQRQRNQQDILRGNHAPPSYDQDPRHPGAEKEPYHRRKAPTTCRRSIRSMLAASSCRTT